MGKFKVKTGESTWTSLVLENELKTVNNQSIIGSGNIDVDVSSKQNVVAYSTAAPSNPQVGDLWIVERTK